MWWKIYFWIFTILTILGLFAYAGFENWNLGTWFEIISSLLAVAGLWAYVYKKELFNIITWKVLFWIIVISWGFNIIYAFTPLEQIFTIPDWLTSQSVTDQTTLLIGIVLASPAAYAIYKLAYPDKVVAPAKKRK